MRSRAAGLRSQLQTRGRPVPAAKASALNPVVMTDYFALLNEPRRPWIDSESLKAKFHAISGDLHPDRVHAEPESQKREAQNAYTELNAAYRCLGDRKERLFHLLCLELGSKPPDVQA